MTLPFRNAWTLVAALFLTGCGYVGEPLPPLVNIPATATDLRAVQRGDKIIVEFTPPELTTEGMVIKKPLTYDLRVGKGGQGAFDANAWAASAEPFPVVARPGEGARAEISVGRFVDQEVFVSVKVIGENMRDAGWSNFAVLTVLPALAPPAELTVENVAEGVRVRWKGSAPRYRLFRFEGDAADFVSLGTVETDSYLDKTTAPDKRYRYQVQAVRPAGAAEAESEKSEVAVIQTRDVAPPSVPAGVRIVAGLASIELAWEPSPETDVSAYRLYRGIASGELVRLAESETPAYSDRAVKSGTNYRYSVSAIDRAGNESARSEVVEADAP